MSWWLSRWDVGLMSVPGWPGRRAGLATGFAWDGSLPVEPVGVVLGRWPDVGTGMAWPVPGWPPGLPGTGVCRSSQWVSCWDIIASPLPVLAWTRVVSLSEPIQPGKQSVEEE